ncbi:hypothetical protein [Microbacterium sp.]|uniref:hypothetical protein n=1 Tax=Microbacterium sp. TaxID=51671 RepID=UPI0039E3BFBF
MRRVVRHVLIEMMRTVTVRMATAFGASKSEISLWRRALKQVDAMIGKIVTQVAAVLKDS